jgi:hypothetical protein
MQISMQKYGSLQGAYDCLNWSMLHDGLAQMTKWCANKRKNPSYLQGTYNGLNWGMLHSDLVQMTKYGTQISVHSKQCTNDGSLGGTYYSLNWSMLQGNVVRMTRWRANKRTKYS